MAINYMAIKMVMAQKHVISHYSAHTRFLGCRVASLRLAVHSAVRVYSVFLNVRSVLCPGCVSRLPHIPVSFYRCLFTGVVKRRGSRDTHGCVNVNVCLCDF
jgi:hypothetical protein